MHNEDCFVQCNPKLCNMKTEDRVCDAKCANLYARGISGQSNAI